MADRPTFYISSRPITCSREGNIFTIKTIMFTPKTSLSSIGSNTLSTFSNCDFSSLSVLYNFGTDVRRAFLIELAVQALCLKGW